MRRAAAVLTAFAGNAVAHPGHGGLQGHFHGWGLEHVLLLAVFLVLLFISARK